ncbi:hypothetical protein SteCoe_14212 [Stentor coeruleus]|uniref:Uncharacterized protein n=1 Tax=Stentor coeruleus TaxID=5963 RepID=A0A1R2C6L7_9CILI|nr:hypothetical protein SteCoe_14212 [Stentor coeruleus]
MNIANPPQESTHPPSHLTLSYSFELQESCQNELFPPKTSHFLHKSCDLNSSKQALFEFLSSDSADPLNKSPHQSLHEKVKEYKRLICRDSSGSSNHPRNSTGGNESCASEITELSCGQFDHDQDIMENKKCCNCLIL